MTDPTPQSQDAILELSVRQRAFLLDQLVRAASGKLANGEANRAIRRTVKRELFLDTPTANRLRAEMVAEGLLATERLNRKEYFQPTDRGRAYLEQHRQAVPPLPQGRGKGMIPPSNEDVRRFRISYLLLQLLKADCHTLSQGESNRFDALGKRLDLNSATAKPIRHELAEQGLLTIKAANRFEEYTLTAQGRLKLGTLAFDKDFEFKLRGRVLNDLLEAAREAAVEFTATASAADRPKDPLATENVPEAAQLEDAILRTFDEMVRERHKVTGLVPIHEVREEVRKQFGEAAVRHGVFDSAILACWQAGRIRLVPITDGTKASLEQLQASLPGTGETFFFLESVHEPVAR